MDELQGYDVFDHDGPYSPDYQVTGLKLPMYTESLIEDPAVRAKYRNEPILFLQREPRDVLASMVTLIGGSWFKPEIIGRVESWVADSDGIFSRTFCELHHEANQCDYPDLAKGVLYWRYKSNCLHSMVQLGFKVLKVEYEFLVSLPRPALSQILEFLDLPWSEQLLEHHQLRHEEMTSETHAVGETRVDRPIDDHSVGRWRNVFDAKQVAVIDHFVAASAHCTNADGRLRERESTVL